MVSRPSPIKRWMGELEVEQKKKRKKQLELMLGLTLFDKGKKLSRHPTNRAHIRAFIYECVRLTIPCPCVCVCACACSGRG